MKESNYGRTYSYDEIAQIFGLTPATIRRIERVALLKLSHPKNKDKWREILETISEIGTTRKGAEAVWGGRVREDS